MHKSENSAVEALIHLQEAGQKAKEVRLRQDIQKILEKASQRGGLFTGTDITFLLCRINNVYPGMTAKEQEAAVRRILRKPIQQEREVFAAEVGRRPGRRYVCH